MQLCLQIQKTYSHYENAKNVIKVDPGFKYNSGTNKEFLTVEELRELIQ